MPGPLSGEHLLQRFRALDSFLIAHQHLWRPRPFTHLHLPWETEHPPLAHWLRQQPLHNADAPVPPEAPAPLPQLNAQATELSAIGNLSTTPLPPAPARLDVDVPGRKWQQIEAFGSHLDFQQPTHHWLDWCAGKGHLGRRLLHTGQRLTCLEYDPALVSAGERLSQRHHLTAEHVLQDVMAEHTAHCLSAHHTPVALHACGDLHVRLMQLASRRGCTQLAIAPCCYNRTQGDYQPVSTTASRSALHLSKDDLGLPLSETVTAGQRVRQQRDHSMARRLAFDLLQRHLRQSDDYLPTPSLPSHWLQQPFPAYCQHLADLKGLALPANIDWAALEHAGVARLAEVRNLERVRNLFRRPLELWLVLDRGLYLQEQGYEVQVGTFCDYSLTPRNLMLRAERF